MDTPTLIAGLGSGLLAAVAMAVCYVLSRRYVVGRTGGSMKLLVISHVGQSVLSLAALPLLWADDLPPLSDYAWPLVGSALFYVVAQGGLFYALQHTDASRASPLLGLKIVMLAAIGAVLFGHALAPLQWVAVLLSTAAAVALNYTGGAISTKALIGMLGACLGYSLSDLAFGDMLEVLAEVDAVRAALLSTALCYVLCGVVALPLLPWYGSRCRRDWTDAAGYAVLWLVAITLIVLSFAYVGVVLGNIALAFRGVISIGLGALLAAMGLVHLEQRVSTSVVVRRGVAAITMVIAIALFVSAAQ